MRDIVYFIMGLEFGIKYEVKVWMNSNVGIGLFLELQFVIIFVGKRNLVD